MFKVLIVDDEPLVLEGMKVMIDWQKGGFQICGEAMDGEEAFELIKKCQPDLVVTDIRMPVVDGLQLLQLANQMKQIRAKFVFLSGYAEFAYARTALSHQACYYMLKPIDPEEFDKILLKLRSELETELHERKEKEGEVSTLIKLLLSSSSSENEQHVMISRLEALLEVKGDTEICCVIVESELELAQGLTRSILDEISGYSRFFLFEIGMNRIGILFIGEIPGFYALLEQFQSALNEACGCHVSIFVSDRGRGVHSLGNLYDQTSKLKHAHKLHSPEPEMIKYYNHLLMDEVCYEHYDADETLLQLIENNDSKGIEQAVHKAFLHFRKNKSAPAIIQGFISNLVLEIVNQTGISLFHSLVHMKAGLTNTEQKVIEYCKDAAKLLAINPGSSHVVTDAVNYARKNFNQRIQLNKVAEQLHIQPAYLGQLFKKVMGMSFNDYIHSIRIEEAKKLLRRTDMKISDIARRLGYKDAENFVEKFKVYAQMLPSTYKKG